MNDSHRNWKAYAEGLPLRGVAEAKLYTDAPIMGELLGLGPYSFLNTIAHASYHDRNLPRPAIVLRIRFHLPNELPAIPMKDNYSHYHGGDIFDELTALAALILGTRIEAGPIDREFDASPAGDPYGRPIQYGLKSQPTLIPSFTAPQIPRLPIHRNLVDLKKLEGFKDLRPAEAAVAVKSARLYQRAIWIADSDPDFAWLQMVSAIESAAVHWSSLDNSVDRMTGVTKKFVAFLERFAPSPPTDRPATFAQFNFDDLKTAARVIYGHRSLYLHEGVSFPFPMCVPPRCVDGEKFEEIPISLASSAFGAVWTKKKLPMLLHTFEYIARGALLNWWDTLGAYPPH